MRTIGKENYGSYVREKNPPSTYNPLQSAQIYVFSFKHTNNCKSS